MDAHITPLSYAAAGRLPMEIVERKGVGHPDTICDQLAENRSVTLSRFYPPEAKAQQPAAGEDIKVMGVRHEASISLTVACALVDRYVSGLADYQAKKGQIVALAEAAARSRTRLPVQVQLNTADGASPDSIYLTVTGVSAEAGDDGQVGRGNRVNGLITPYRPTSLEGVAGKNPLSHVGRLYNIIARGAATALVAEVPGVDEAYCFLVSRIGKPLHEPQTLM